jgi:hypothetical protein
VLRLRLRLRLRGCAVRCSGVFAAEVSVCVVLGRVISNWLLSDTKHIGKAIPT